MRKLLLVMLVISINQAFARTNGTSYWQDYGPAQTMPFINEHQHAFKQLIIDKNSQVNLVIVSDEQLSTTALVEFFQIFVDNSEQKINLHKYKLNEFTPITQPIGVLEAKNSTTEQVQQIKQKYSATHKESHSSVYASITEFLHLDNGQSTIHQLITIHYQGENYHYVSVGIVIDLNFYQQYLKLPSNASRAYKMSYALEKVYATDSKHWQLSVTNYKLTKITQLKTAVMSQI